MEHLKRIVFASIAVLLFFGGAEVLLRVMDFPAQDERPTFEHNSVYWQVDPSLNEQPMTHKELRSTFAVSTRQQWLPAAPRRAGPADFSYRCNGLQHHLRLGCG